MSKRRFITPELIQQMKDLESKGMKRLEIATKLDLDPASVTRALGAVRQYRGLRMAQQNP